MTPGPGVAARLSDKLKRLDPVVLPMRFVRRLPQVWDTVCREREEEGHRKARLLARDDRIREYLSRTAVRKLQVGAGTNPLDGWLNTDLEPQSAEVIFLDALIRFPFEDRTFDYAFSEHMIEHIPYTGGLHMLREVFRVMKPGGRIRIATPDVRRIAALVSEELVESQRDYLRWSATSNLGLYSDGLSPLQKRRPEWAIDPDHMRKRFPDPSTDSACFVVNHFFRGYGHQFLYDERTLAAALSDAGFQQIDRATPLTSTDPHLCGIDAHARVIGAQSNEFETLAMEGTRP